MHRRQQSGNCAVAVSTCQADQAEGGQLHWAAERGQIRGELGVDSGQASIRQILGEDIL